MENKKPQQIDDFFKEELENISPLPSNMNWEKISSELEGESLDGYLKHQLKDLQPTPNPKIWNNIKSKLPLSILLRNQLNWLSKIAAVLIIFMIVILVLDKKETKSEMADIVNSTQQEPAEPLLQKEEPVDFVFAINDKSNTNQSSVSEELSLEDEKTIEDFWSGVMDDDDEFLTEVNEKVIEKSLKPILQLPIENLEAALPKKDNTEVKEQLPIIQPTPFLLPDGDTLNGDK